MAHACCTRLSLRKGRGEQRIMYNLVSCLLFTFCTRCDFCDLCDSLPCAYLLEFFRKIMDSPMLKESEVLHFCLLSSVALLHLLHL